MRRVLFLDIDGVLNSEQYFVFDADARRDLDQGDRHIDPILMRNLGLVFQWVPDLKIVISSAWRKMFSIEELEELFKSYSFPRGTIIGMTCEQIKGQKFSQNVERIEQIQEYMDDHDLTWVEVAIVDDNMLDLGYGVEQAYPLDRFVQTDNRDGLTYSKAIELASKFVDKKDLKIPVVLI